MAIRKFIPLNAKTQSLNMWRQLLQCKIKALKENSKVFPVEEKFCQIQKVKCKGNSFQQNENINTTTTLSEPFIPETSLGKTIMTKKSLFCGAKLKENESKYINIMVNWIQCDMSTIWMYLPYSVPTFQHIPANYMCHINNWETIMN